MEGHALSGTFGSLGTGSFKTWPRTRAGVTLLQSELKQMQAIASGIPPGVDPQRQLELQRMAEKQKVAAERVSGWQNLLCNARQRRLLERQLQQQRREEELLKQDEEEDRRRRELEKVLIERAEAVVAARDEKIRCFTRAQMIADTIAGQREQLRWAEQKRSMEKMRQLDFLREQQDLNRQLVEREQRDKQEQQAKAVQAQAFLRQQIDEMAQRKKEESEKLAAEAEATKRQLEEEQKAEREAEKAKQAESKRLYRELVRANEELQERRKAADVQQKAEEALAFACASKLQQREAMIRKRKEELRAWALERSARLTAQGAAALATAQAEEARHQKIQVARFEADAKQAEEAEHLRRMTMQLQLKESRDGQVEAKRREKERKTLEDAAYAESLSRAAAAAQEDEDRRLQEQRMKLWKVGEDQKRQARERQQLKKLQREQALEEERRENQKALEADFMMQRFAEQGISAAKAIGAEWRILEKAKNRLLRQSSLYRPPTNKDADSVTATPLSPTLCREQRTVEAGHGSPV